MKDINLLPKKNLGLFQRDQTILIARSIAALSVIFVLSSFVGILLLGRNYSVADIETQQQNIRTKLQTQHTKTIQELMLLDRMKHISTILKTRSLLIDKITALQKLMPATITIEVLSITPQTLNLTVESPSLDSLKGFLDGLTTLLQSKKLLKKLTINNVVINQRTGLYTVSVVGVFL